MSTDSKYMSEQIKERLLGGTITEVVLTADEQSFGFKVTTDAERVLVWVDRDAEGNGPGWLSME